jgi:UDP-glucose 4-epimerase
MARKYETLNVGTGRGTSVLEIINAFEQVSGIVLPYELGSRREGDLTSIYASVDKAKKLINWQAEESLPKALTDAWRWQQSLQP